MLGLNIYEIRFFLINLWKEFHENAFDISIKGLKSPLFQIIEMIQLRVGPGKIVPADYYMFQLYDDAKFDKSEKKKFMSQWALPDSFRKIAWHAIGNDKFIFYTLMYGFGASLPINYAFFHDYRNGGDLKVLRNQSDLREYLLYEATYPLIVKPNDGIFSKGFQVIHSCQPEKKQLSVSGGSLIDIDSFVQEIDLFRQRGMLFQEMLLPHPYIEKLCGRKIGTFRVITGVYPGGVSLLSTLWKIPVGSNMADNFWRGNMVAPVDPESGEIGRCVKGMGKDLTTHETHPDTGEQLTGKILPDWEIALEKCLYFSSCLSGIPLQAWDIAMTNRGPVFLEVNINGSLFLPQLAWQKGFRSNKLNFLIEKTSRT